MEVSGFCGPQYSFRRVICRNVSPTFVELCMHGDHILVDSFGPPIWPPGNRLFFFYKSSFLSLESWRTCTYAYSLKPEMVKRLKIKRRDFFFFNETGFLFWCYALCKLVSLNCYVFEMKHASGLETTKIFILFIFKLV